MNSSELISNEELSALVTDKKGGDRSSRNAVTPYNFRRPDRLSKDQLRGIYLLHDLLAHSLSSSLPLFLKAVCGISLISVEQQSFEAYIKGVADPTTIYTLYSTEFGGGFAIEVSTPIAFPVIDRMLGGVGEDLEEKRPATDLELNVLEGFVDLFVDSYREAWAPIIELEPEVTSRETRPALVQLVPPNEVVVTISYQVQIGEAKGAISICIPIATLEPVMTELNPVREKGKNRVQPESRAGLMNNLGSLLMEVAVELEPLALTYLEVSSLKPGDIIKTTHRVAKAVTVRVEGRKKLKATLAGRGREIIARIESRV